ncbi:hypothetical protein [Natrinema saccharevitans]|uniref:hypothetical protein n=1 Tax=Natrinema saccharevitans TaxID=301967 RepID=UPI00111568D4|nr:hypothetical protein [Natrinema saccharevitans]
MYGAVYGVLLGVPLTAVGVGVIESPLYGAIAGLFGAVGGFLFLPWLLCMNAADTTEAGVSYYEMLDLWGMNFRLGVFGIGLKVGGILILVIGKNTQSVTDLALGIRAGFITIVGSTLLALIAGWYFDRHQDGPTRDRSTLRKFLTQQEQSNDDSGTTPISVERLLSPDTLGEAFGVFFIASIVFLFLSVIGFGIYLMLIPEASGTLGIAALTVSWVGITVSLFGYSVWSAWQLRQLPRADQPTVRSLVGILIHATVLVIVEPDNLDAYDRRLRLTAITLVLSIIALSAPLLAQIGGPGRIPDS